MAGTSATLLAAALGSSALAQVLVSEQPKTQNTLVVIFLRGGADGLNWVVPYFESGYYAARPSLSIPAPNSAGGDKARAFDLDGKFGLHPSFGALRDRIGEGEVAFVHACGSGDRTRSHFEAMSLMERGLFREESGNWQGWLGAYLKAVPRSDAAVRAVAIGSLMPDSLTGSSALALSSLQDLHIDSQDTDQISALRKSYADARGDRMGDAGSRLFQALDRLKDLNAKTYRPGGNAKYPVSDLGEGLRQVAMLIKARVGLEVACLDRGSWDTHVSQGSTTGWFADNVQDVADSLEAFRRDLGSGMENVTVVVQTEFGRRVQENVVLGTDHGRGSVMMVMGGGVRGGMVHGAWPGLGKEDLDEVGDLRVVNDYRNVLGEILTKRFGLRHANQVFHDLDYRTLEVLA
ncbi:MAG: DUF1501 domain-containing protein [Armatimonadetes bacterium]|nr:DUF1501 domain-containing protein [Armatimonadota bacterium]